jgi:hydroxymethylbilane synthase
VQAAVAPINDANAEAALTAERALVSALGGGCQTPIGALARPAGGDALELIAIVVSLDGATAVRASVTGTRGNPAAIGEEAAAQLLQCGAAEILAEAQRAPGAVGGIQP